MYLSMRCFTREPGETDSKAAQFRVRTSEAPSSCRINTERAILRASLTRSYIHQPPPLSSPRCAVPVFCVSPRLHRFPRVRGESSARVRKNGELGRGRQRGTGDVTNQGCRFAPVFSERCLTGEEWGKDRDRRERERR